MDYPLNENLLALVERTGYNIAQENGQRKTGPPPFWNGPPPPKGCEIFIGKLPRDVEEDELFPLLETAGAIYELRLMMDFSKSNRGFAFCTYASKAEAQRAIALLDGFEIRPGRRIGVLKSVDNCKLYITGLPTDKSEKDIFSEISKYTTGVVNVTVFGCSINKTKNRGFAFVEYESHRAASMARRVLIPGYVKLFNIEVQVDWAKLEPEIDEELMRSVTILYVRNLPPHSNEGFIFGLFSFRGSRPIHKIKRMRDFAFVHYFSRADAEFALSRLNGLDLGGGAIEVTWAKPRLMAMLPEKQYKWDQRMHLKSYSSNTFDEMEKQYQSFDNRSFVESPTQLLCRFCQLKGWGKPVFQVLHTSSSADETEITFSAKVYIPNMPLPQKFFSFTQTFHSPVEAKNYAAEYILSNITSLYNVQTSAASVTDSTHQQNDVSDSCYNNIPDRTVWNTPSIWNPLPEVAPPVSNGLLEVDDSFLTLLASAATLANIELQSKNSFSNQNETN